MEFHIITYETLVLQDVRQRLVSRRDAVVIVQQQLGNWFRWGNSTNNSSTECPVSPHALLLLSIAQHHSNQAAVRGSARRTPPRLYPPATHPRQVSVGLWFLPFLEFDFKNYSLWFLIDTICHRGLFTQNHLRIFRAIVRKRKNKLTPCVSQMRKTLKNTYMYCTHINTHTHLQTRPFHLGPIVRHR